ncbi:MAG: Spy/CpxP family protein refolding chaperone [Vicinamibacterales bacterium]
MQNKTIVSFNRILVLAGVVVITAAVGFATTVQLAARSGQGAGQEQAGPGGRRGPGMMAQGMRGPGGPGMRGGPGGGPFGLVGAGLRGLDLTDAQREQVRAIMESHRDEQKAIGDRMQAARKALHEVIAADAVDEGAIRAKAGEVGAVEADAAVLQAKIRAEVFGILTPEQAAKAKAFRSQMEQRMKDGRGQGRGMRPHPGPRPETRPEPRVEGDISFPETV